MAASTDYAVRLTVHDEETPFIYPLWAVTLLLAFLNTRGWATDLLCGWIFWGLLVTFWIMVRKDVGMVGGSIMLLLVAVVALGITILEDRYDVHVWGPIGAWIKTLTPPWNAKFMTILALGTLVEWLWVMMTDWGFNFVELTPNEFQVQDGVNRQSFDMGRVTFRCDFTRDPLVFFFGIGGGDLIVTIDGTEKRYKNIFFLWFKYQLQQIRERKRVTTT